MNWIIFYDYTSLFLVFFIFISLFYALIALTHIPYDIAKKRNHPHQEAILIAGWLSLFTLQVLWPFVMIWAALYTDKNGWGTKGLNKSSENDIDDLKKQLTSLKNRCDALEKIHNEREGEK